MTTPISLAALMTVRLKGRVDADMVARATGQDTDQVTAVLESAAAAGTLKSANGRYRITPEGREHLTQLVSDERATLDGGKLEGLYERFDAYNSILKSIVTDWQLRPDGSPNDHADASYDDAIVCRLSDLHRTFTPWLHELGNAAPRLASYAARFVAALDAVRAGDHSFIAKPITDSYHTVWFEVHEELMALTGRERAAEAAAGRAE